MNNILVLGAGSWGTALAIHLAKAGHKVHLWSHRCEHVQKMKNTRTNSAYLPNIDFPDNLQLTKNIHIQSKPCGIFIAVPSNALSQTLKKIKENYPNLPKHIALATKGFDPISHNLPHQIVQKELGIHIPITVISGPTFAQEVAKGLPTAMVSASTSTEESEFWSKIFHHDAIRLYTGTDITGVEVGGAYKNIIAIATGVCDGLNLGSNARAALISRGLAEMIRFGTFMGGKTETLMGLTGLGDLVLTCTDNLSRNRRFGLKLALSEQSVDEIQKEIGQVIEGIKAVGIIKKIADKNKFDLPIMNQVYKLIEGKTTPKESVKILLSRPLKNEKIL